MTGSVNYHAKHFYIRDPDFNDPELIYQVYDEIRELRGTRLLRSANSDSGAYTVCGGPLGSGLVRRLRGDSSRLGSLHFEHVDGASGRCPPPLLHHARSTPPAALSQGSELLLLAAFASSGQK